MLHIDIPTLAEFPGQLTSKMDERDNACGTASSPSTGAKLVHAVWCNQLTLPNRYRGSAVRQLPHNRNEGPAPEECADAEVLAAANHDRLLRAARVAVAKRR
jgi:hypothetical protein